MFSGHGRGDFVNARFVFGGNSNGTHCQTLHLKRFRWERESVGSFVGKSLFTIGWR